MRMRRRLAPFLLLTALVSCIVSACGDRPAQEIDLWESSTIRQAKERGRLVVAMEVAFEPFEYKDPSGKAIGFDVDLAQEVADALGVSLEIRDVAWDTIRAELLTGKADLIISGMTITMERALTVSFTQPYFQTGTCLLVSKERASDVKSVADLNRPGRKVVVHLGTTGEEAAKRLCPQAEIITHPDAAAAALEVALGRADALVYDLLNIRKHHANHPDTTFVLPALLTVEPYAIACRKGDPESIAWLNLLLDTLRRTGRMKELYERHGLEEPDAPR